MTDFSKPQNGPEGQPQGAFPPPPGNWQPGAPGPSSQPGQFGQPGQPGAYYPPAQPGAYYPPAPTAPTGGAPPGYYFHQESGLTLPNGTELASHGRRIGAFFLAIPLSIVTLFIGYLIWGLISWGKGTSPALGVLKMKCYKPADGRVATFGTMALRDIVGGIVQGILSFVTLLVSFIMFLATGKRQTLADLVGGTVVLYDPNNVLG